MEETNIIKEILDELTNKLATVEDTVVASVQDTVAESVEDTVAESVEDTVITTVEDTVITTVEDTVAESLQETVVESAITTLEDTVVANVQEPIVKVNTYSFIHNAIKMKLLAQANTALHIDKSNTNKIVFVYSGPKVGSTSIVSSLRIFASDKLNIIHIHDEEMLKVLVHIEGITINELILYNKFIGRIVYVIDVYRSPIERKISAFFEKIGAYHFNTTDENINKYNIHRVINRFNKLLPHLANGDHFIDKYNINIPTFFDFGKKYLLVEEHGIKYIKLRLKDSAIWGTILTTLFGIKIHIVKDYESSNKPIKDLYFTFKSAYKIPQNLLSNIMLCKYLKYYYSSSELSEYYKKWSLMSTNNVVSYTADEYKIYEEISIENSHIDYIQIDHYIDDGCKCMACIFKRKSIAKKVIHKIPLTILDQVKHSQAKKEMIIKQIEVSKKINNIMLSQPNNKKNFKENMNTIVKGRGRFL